MAATQAAQPTNTFTPEPTNTPTPEQSDTPTPEPTDTPVPTRTARSTDTPEPTATKAPTDTPTARAAEITIEVATPTTSEHLVACSLDGDLTYDDVNDSDEYLGKSVCWKGKTLNISRDGERTIFQARYCPDATEKCSVGDIDTFIVWSDGELTMRDGGEMALIDGEVTVLKEGETVVLDSAYDDRELLIYGIVDEGYEGVDSDGIDAQQPMLYARYVNLWIDFVEDADGNLIPESLVPESTEPTDTPESTEAFESTKVSSSGYTLSVVGIEDPATPHPRLYEPEGGTKPLAVEVVLGNVSGDVHSVNVYNGTLVDQDGFSYRPEPFAREGGYIDRIDLAPGEKARGWIPFEVPVGTVADYIKYEFSGYPDITLTASVNSESPEVSESVPAEPLNTPVPTEPPATSTPIPLSRDDDFGVQKQAGTWGMKLYDVKRAKAVYRYDDAEVAQGVWLLSFVEFANMGTGTNSPWDDLDFYLFNDQGWSYKADWNKASSKAGWQFQAGDIMDDINPGLMLGVVLAVDVPEDMGDVWLRVEQDPGFAIYLGNASSIPLE